MRGIIAAVIATVTATIWAEPPLAQATLKTHYKGGKSESRRVQLARQPDGAWRFELRTADMPGNAQWIDLVSDAAVRRQGDPGWWMVDDGRWGAFTRNAGKTVVSNMRMPFFGMKTAEGKAWFAIVKGMRYETSDRLAATNGVYQLSARLKLSNIGFPPYENWVIDFYELDGADATYSGMGRLYRKWQLDRSEVKPLRERVKGNDALAYAAEAFFVRCKFGRCDRTKTTREDWLKAMPPVLVEHTFEDFKDIMRRFKEIGIDKAEMCMVGFQKGGHDGPFPDLFPADDRFGGEKGMRDAIAYGKSLGYRMNCHINQNNFYRNAKRWNIDDVAKDRDGNPLKYTVYPGGQVYRSCWEVCCKKYVDKDIADEKDLGLNGLFHVDVTSAILPGVCHDPKHPNNRKSMREWQLKVGEKVRAAFGGYSSECGIDHCAPMLDNALYVSTFPGWHSQKSDLVDGYLPIWHVVYSGIIMSQPFYATIDAPCARGTGSGKTDAVRGSEAVTTYLDTPERRTLKVFELNGRPTFYYTDYKDLAPIKRMYDLWQPLKHLQFEFLDDHAEIAPDVFRSRYSNGEEVVCNYTDKPFYYRGQPVASLAYRLFSAAECACAVPTSADYPVKEADMTNVTITAGFWLPRFETNRVVTVKADFDKSEETGRLANFREAAKRAKGTFKGCPFDDSDVFKIIEGAAYTLATHPDPELEKYLDNLIADIAGAQEPDGYLYTARTLGMEKVKGFPRAKMMGPERWSNTGASHEFYNMGHMIEASVAYWQVTGKRQLLDVAIKAADMMDRTFGYAPGQIQRVPGHEEIELALCKLYRATGEVRYLKLAKTLLDFRGNGRAYNQNHLPVTQQDQACGHAVRAGYLYTAMADVAALLGDSSYRVASERLWKDVVDTKLHLNGGIGAHRHAVVPGFGSVGEAFGAPYDLPNESAYLETCAAIANALWNERLFLFSGDGKYMDVIERIIYNGFLSGISMSGDEFFYPNPLASAGGYARSKWFGCSCCPVNVVRFIPQIAQYAYATSGNTAYLNLFVASEAKLRLAGGTVKLVQETDYPWSGKVKIKVVIGETASGQQQGNFTLNVRIPGWCVGQPVPSTLYEQTAPSSPSNFKVKVNGGPFAFAPEKGYCSIGRFWKNGDVVEVDMDMPVKRIKADARVEADRGRLAVERGPIVWCAEGIDNGGRALDIVLPANAAFTEKSVDVCGVKMPALATTGCHVQKGIAKVKVGPACPIMLIPYFAWCHREAGEMQTWFPTSPDVAAASTAQALKAKTSYSHPGESTASLFDGVFPKNGAAYDNRQKRCTFWPHKGTEEWVEVILPAEETVRGVDVYWFDDEPVGGCRVPAEWKIQTQLGEMTGWQDAATSCPIVKGNWSSVTFAKPMPAVAVRLQIKLKKGFSSGICELRLR